MIAVTYACQCHCVHCAVSDVRQDDVPELSTAEIKQVIDQAGRMRFLKIGFTGGEPLLRKDLEELIHHAYVRGLSTSVDTNGILLTEEKVLQLEKAGLSNINVSMDHFEARRHDERRGWPGCFDLAAQGIRYCAQHSIPCVVSTYVTDESIQEGHFLKIVDLAKKMGAKGVRALFPVYSGELCNIGKSLLSDSHKEYFFRHLVDGGFVYSESPLFDYLTGRMECAAEKKLSVYITAYGDVKQCYSVKEILGNVRRQPLTQILRGYSRRHLADCLQARCQSCSL